MVETDKHQIDGSWIMIHRTECKMRYLKTNVKDNVSIDDVTIYDEASSTSMFKISSLPYRPLMIFETIPTC